ncbi:hypothetical protein [Actinopolyspora halophila]|uniref:hypothetical protein n=1 Tax=Actinopolyspora halophila TaxID=1850 RepID=UPI000380B249|nr:hypothetical protein [Actinopolyspora halophila]
MRKMRKALVTFVVTIAGAGLVAPSAAATDRERPEEAAGSEEFAAGLQAAQTGAQTSRYVKASSPEQAMRILDALQSPQTASPSDKALAANVQYGPCTLKPSVIHLRTSGDRNTLGAKPVTTCEVPVTSIRHDTDLRYKWWLWWSLADSYPGPGNQNQKRYEQKNVAWRCNGADSTTWAGTTVGTMVFGGETYYARVYQTPVDKDCGA